METKVAAFLWAATCAELYFDKLRAIFPQAAKYIQQANNLLKYNKISTQNSIICISESIS